MSWFKLGDDIWCFVSLKGDFFFCWVLPFFSFNVCSCCGVFGFCFSVLFLFTAYSVIWAPSFGLVLICTCLICYVCVESSWCLVRVLFYVYRILPLIICSLRDENQPVIMLCR